MLELPTRAATLDHLAAGDEERLPPRGLHHRSRPARCWPRADEEAIMASPEPTLTKDQLDTLRRRLEDERSRILRVLQAPAASVASDDERAELEETAQRATEQTHQLGIAERERTLLAEVERALAKIGDGTYGVGEKSGEPIPYDRVRAVPWARDDVDD
jgi:DnaK suppressor protein